MDNVLDVNAFATVSDCFRKSYRYHRMLEENIISYFASILVKPYVQDDILEYVSVKECCAF